MSDRYVLVPCVTAGRLISCCGPATALAGIPIAKPEMRQLRQSRSVSCQMRSRAPVRAPAHSTSPEQPINFLIPNCEVFNQVRLKW
jgi:hypothetical protein